MKNEVDVGSGNKGQGEWKEKDVRLEQVGKVQEEWC